MFVGVGADAINVLASLSVPAPRPNRPVVVVRKLNIFRSPMVYQDMTHQSGLEGVRSAVGSAPRLTSAVETATVETILSGDTGTVLGERCGRSSWSRHIHSLPSR